MTVFISKIQIIHNLTVAATLPGTNADTEFSPAPVRRTRYILQGSKIYCLRISRLRFPSIISMRILLGKPDVKDAYW